MVKVPFGPGKPMPGSPTCPFGPIEPGAPFLSKEK